MCPMGCCSVFKTSYSQAEKNKEESSGRNQAAQVFCLASSQVLGECCHAIQRVIFYVIKHVLAENLFHFKANQADYSIKPEEHGTKPLFVDKGGSKTMLKEFFFCVFSKVSSWQSMSEFK